MNDHKEHISHYSAADIQRYVQGKLSSAEMHAMEKAALDDPFLADAMEGMQQAFSEHEENLVTDQLQQLQQQFQTRTTGKAKVVAFKPFRYWQAAAAVVVIVAGVWIYSLVNRNTAENNTAIIAKTEKKEPQQQLPAPSLADAKETVTTDSVTPPTDVAAKTSEWYRNKERATANKPIAPDAPATSAQSSNLSNSIAKKDVPAESFKQAQDDANRNFAKPEMKDVVVGKNKEAAAPSAAAATEPVKALRNDSDIDKWQEREAETELITIAKTESKSRKAVVKDKNLSGVIKGQVTDHFNNPVANAYVQLQKNNNNNFINNFITDKSGFFKIPVSDSVVNVAVNVSGYGTQNFTLQNNTGMNQLQLQPANYNYGFNNFNNKYPQAGVVNNNKQLSANYKFPNVVLYDAEPAYGWVAFGQYLEKNKMIPAGSDNVSGNVVLSFEVNKRGELYDYKIEQSLSKAHDEEAIRLIKQGPSWKLRSGRKARVTVMVRF